MANRFFVLGSYPSGRVQLINSEGYPTHARAVQARNWMGEPRGFQTEPKRESRFVDDDGTEWAVAVREGDSYRTDRGDLWTVGHWLEAAEVDGLPWIMAGVLAPAGQFDFDPAAFDAVEVAPCCVWRDEDGEDSTERADAGQPVAMWSVYLHFIPDPARNVGGVDCVADFSNEGAALAFAAVLCSQYGYDPGAGSAVEAMQIASGAPRYVIEPQADEYEGKGEGGETHFGPCAEREAESFVVFYYGPGEPRGEAEPLECCNTRADAVRYINRARHTGPAQ